MRIRSGALCVLFVLSASAQVKEEITVDVIEVPVHVVRRGKAVTGLTRDQFELYINGKQHPFEYFDVIDARGRKLPGTTPEVAAAEEAVPAQLQRRNLTVLLFDTTATSHRYLLRASEAAQKFVAEAPPHETFAVARLNPDGVQFIVPFTLDRVAVLRACKTLRPSRAGDALGLATLEAERAFTLTSVAPGGVEGVPDAALQGLDSAQVVRASTDGDGVAPPLDSAADSIANMQAMHEKVTNQIRSDNELRAARHLGFLAERLAPISGVKHVILFAEGGRRAADPNSAARMHAKFQAAGVILDAVELDAMRVPGMIDIDQRVDRSLWSNPTSRYPEDRTEPLYTLALGTGGTVTKHSNVIDGLRLLREIQAVTYVLGFRPPQTGKVQNEITVKVKKQPFGTAITYRKGYTTGSRTNRNEGLFLADVMMNDIPQRGLTLDLDVDPLRSGAKVSVSVPGQELLAREADGPKTDIDVFLYVFNEHDLVAAWAYWRLNVDLEKGREFLASNRYEIQRLFSLGPGRFSAKALLRFPNTDITGFQRADFEVVAR